MRTAEGSGARALLLWVALLVGFSPVLTDLVDHLVAEAWSRYVLVFVPLCIVCLTRGRGPQPRQADGFLWLATAVVAELFAVGGSTTRLARPALVLGAIGLCRAFGLARARDAALCAWLAPVPVFLLRLASPRLEEALLALAGAALRALGVEVEVDGRVALAASGVLKLRRWNGGLPLVALLSGLGWYASLRGGSSLAASLCRAAVWGVLALPLQALGVLGAVALLAAGAPQAAGMFLDHGFWASVAALAVAHIEWRLRAAPPRVGDQGSSGGGLAS